MASTILVVDDEKNIVQLARLYLNKEGFEVEAAYDGAQALEDQLTTCAASSAEFTCGTITPSAPRSKTFLIGTSPAAGTRTMQAARPPTACSEARMSAVSNGPCSPSMNSQSNPTSANISATEGAVSVTIGPYIVWPLLRRCRKVLLMMLVRGRRFTAYHSAEYAVRASQLFPHALSTDDSTDGVLECNYPPGSAEVQIFRTAAAHCTGVCHEH